MNDTELAKSFTKLIKESKDFLKTVGFEELVLEDFHELLVN